MRLIDADKLLEEVNKLKESPWFNEGKELRTVSYVAKKETVEIIEDLCIKQQPTVEERPKGKWIPVGERLPEDGQVCLVTTKGFLDDICCEITTYSNNLYKIDRFDFYDKENVSGFYGYDSECGYYEDDDVIAWMPLPEPYKAENKTEQGLDYADQNTLMSAT